MPLRLSTISSAVVFFTVHVYKFTLFSPPVYIVSLVSCLVLLNIFMKSSIRKKITEISGCAGSVHICVVSHVAIGNIPVPSCKGSNACYLQGFFYSFTKWSIYFATWPYSSDFTSVEECIYICMLNLWRVQVGLHQRKLPGAHDCSAKCSELASCSRSRALSQQTDMSQAKLP